jgi:hypothetical protein
LRIESYANPYVQPVVRGSLLLSLSNITEPGVG